MNVLPWMLWTTCSFGWPGSVSFHFLRKYMYVECMVVLIRINNFQDPLVNLRLKSTYDDLHACWFCVYIYYYISSLSFYWENYLDWVFSVHAVKHKKNKFSKKFPKYYIPEIVNTFFPFSDQWTSTVPSNFCTPHD